MPIDRPAKLDNTPVAPLPSPSRYGLPGGSPVPELPRTIVLYPCIHPDSPDDAPIPGVRLECEHGGHLGTYYPGVLDTLVVTSESGICVGFSHGQGQGPGEPGGLVVE